MTLGTLLVILLFVLLLGAMPGWPHSRGWGFFPSGAMALILVVVVVLLVSNGGMS